MARQLWYGNDADTPPALRPPRWLGSLGGRYRYTERLILDGQPLSAVGEFQTRRAGDDPLSLDAEMAQRLRTWETGSGAHGADRYQSRWQHLARGWEQARAAARAQILAEHREQAQQPGLNLLVRPQDHRPFLFGPGSVRALSQRYRISAALLSGGRADLPRHRDALARALRLASLPRGRGICGPV